MTASQAECLAERSPADAWRARWYSNRVTQADVPLPLRALRAGAGDGRPGRRPGDRTRRRWPPPASGGLFDNKAVFVDHAGLFDYPSLRNLVGATLQAVYQTRARNASRA